MATREELVEHLWQTIINPLRGPARLQNIIENCKRNSVELTQQDTLGMPKPRLLWATSVQSNRRDPQGATTLEQ